MNFEDQQLLLLSHPLMPYVLRAINDVTGRKAAASAAWPSNGPQSLWIPTFPTAMCGSSLRRRCRHAALVEAELCAPALTECYRVPAVVPAAGREGPVGRAFFFEADTALAVESC